jgi:uncharacterized protein YjeT (DUF2065 family)
MTNMMPDAPKEMRIERDGDKLVVTSENTQRFAGFFSIAVGIVILLFVSRINTSSPGWLPPMAFGAFVALVFIAFGATFLFPRRVTTVFDLRSREVRRTADTPKWWKPMRTQTAPFADIVSIGFNQPDGSEEGTYNAVIRLRTGNVMSIAASFTGEIDVEAIDQIAATTGLKKWNVGDKSAG